MEDDDRAADTGWFIAVATAGSWWPRSPSAWASTRPTSATSTTTTRPKSLENYAQEIGRAGRDGRPPACEIFACPEDVPVLENFAYGDTPTAGGRRGAGGRGVRPRRGFRRQRVRAVRPRHPLYGCPHVVDVPGISGHLTRHAVLRHYQFRPLKTRPKSWGISRANAARFGRFVPPGAAGKTWFHLDVDEAGRAIGARDRVVRALDYLAERQFLELKVAGVRHRFKLSAGPTIRPLCRGRCTSGPCSASGRNCRLGQVTAWVEQDGCQVAALGTHFGDPPRQPCGHCLWCRRGGRRRLPPRGQPWIDPEQWSRALSVRRQNGEMLRDARSFARFLCGVSSPRMVRAKLQSHPLFGTFADVPFPTVLERAETKDEG